MQTIFLIMSCLDFLKNWKYVYDISDVGKFWPKLWDTLYCMSETSYTCWNARKMNLLFYDITFSFNKLFCKGRWGNSWIILWEYREEKLLFLFFLQVGGKESEDFGISRSKPSVKWRAVEIMVFEILGLKSFCPFVNPGGGTESQQEALIFLSAQKILLSSIETFLYSVVSPYTPQ